MFTKSIRTACAIILALASASCQKSNMEQLMGMQEEMIELMENIKDQSSADKNAEKLTVLRKKSEEIQKSMTEEEKKELWSKEEYIKILFRKEPLRRALFNKDYYGSFKLKKAVADNA